jgi:hypothetical protein
MNHTDAHHTAGNLHGATDQAAIARVYDRHAAAEYERLIVLCFIERSSS